MKWIDLIDSILNIIWMILAVIFAWRGEYVQANWCTLMGIMSILCGINIKLGK